MDGNKDESEHCISIAQKYINEGDRSKALKFLYKAEKLFPSQRAKDLIELLEKLSDASGDHSRTRSPSGESECRNRSSSARRKSTEPVKADYTEDQLEAVQKIKKCKGFYEVLGVSKEAGDSEIKKQYRKLALQFHPDKNKAPGATEAFKAIGNAFAVLSDAEKRKQYDDFGSIDNHSSQGPSYHRNSHYYEYSRGFESDISAEELFNMFFGGTFGPGTPANTRRPQRRFARNNNARYENNYSVVMQILPVIMLVILSVMTSFFIGDPVYSLSKSSKYPSEKTTGNLRVPYFVKENFNKEYQGSILRLEDQVEDDHIANLRGACFKESNYIKLKSFLQKLPVWLGELLREESMIWRARNFRDRAQEDRAKSLKTPSCDKLNDIYARDKRHW